MRIMGPVFLASAQLGILPTALTIGLRFASTSVFHHDNHINTATMSNSFEPVVSYTFSLLLLPHSFRNAAMAPSNTNLKK